MRDTVFFSLFGISTNLKSVESSGFDPKLVHLVHRDTSRTGSLYKEHTSLHVSGGHTV